MVAHASAPVMGLLLIIPALVAPVPLDAPPPGALPPTLTESGLDTRCDVYNCTSLRLDADVNEFNFFNTSRGGGAADALYWGDDTVWTEGSDGAGTGLDADLLDDLSSGDFALAGHDHDARYLRRDQSGTLEGDLTVTGDVDAGGLLAGSLKLRGTPRASLPSAGMEGRVARVSDGARGLWMDSGSAWFQLQGDVVNVKEFGAVGDGVADDTAALQAAADAAWAAGRDVGVPGAIGREVGATLYLPPGKYLVTQTISLKAYINLVAPEGAMLYADDPSVDILNVYSYMNRFHGVRFGGGRHHIVLAGPASLGGVVRITDCEFAMPSEAAILMPTDTTGRYVFAGQLIVDNFYFEGRKFFKGVSDGAAFTNGLMGWFPESATDYAWDTADSVTLRDIVAVPAPTNDGGRAVWINFGGGRLVMDDVRFGGEGGGRTIVRTFHLSEELGASRVILRDSAAYATDNFWMQAYDRVPALIDVSNSEGLEDTKGIYFDASVDLDNRTDHRSALIRMHDLTTATPILRGTDPYGPGPFTDVASKLRALIAPPAGFNVLNPLPQPNLFVPDITATDQAGFLHTVGGMQDAPDDTSTGYSLQVGEAYANGAYWYIHTPPWGGAVAAGDYVVSLFFKADHSGELLVYLQDKVIEKMTYFATKTYQQLYAPFYHNGQEGRFAFGVPAIPNGSHVSLGLFAVHRGDAPAPYTFPGNPTAAPLRETYQGSSAPTSGTYKVGDITWNTAPDPGDYVGWVCVAPGSPGTWKGFGAIAA